MASSLMPFSWNGVFANPRFWSRYLELMVRREATRRDVFGLPIGELPGDFDDESLDVHREGGTKPHCPFSGSSSSERGWVTDAEFSFRNPDAYADAPQMRKPFDDANGFGQIAAFMNSMEEG